MSTPFQLRNELVEFGRRLYQRNHIGAAEGNLSARLADNKIMITPSGISKGYMKSEDPVVCDMTGKKLQGALKPSSEIKLHAAIYKWRPDIFAICHAHPIYATGYSTARIPLMRPILAEVVGTIGGVPLTHYGAPGTAELPETLAALINRYDAFLLEAHGVISLGKTIEDAYNKIEIVERYARILYVAERLGPVKELSSAEIDRLLKGAGRLNIKDELMGSVNLTNPSGQGEDSKQGISSNKKGGSAGYR